MIKQEAEMWLSSKSIATSTLDKASYSTLSHAEPIIQLFYAHQGTEKGPCQQHKLNNILAAVTMQVIRKSKLFAKQNISKEMPPQILAYSSTI